MTDTPITDSLRDELRKIAEGNGRPGDGDAGAGTSTPPPPEWLLGDPMDPLATSAESLPLLEGFPFLHAGMGAVIVGPTGRGRSSLVQACLYDAAREGLSCAYLGAEVTQDEFSARAAHLADVRGDEVTDGLRGELARARYLNLASVIAQAWADPQAWASDAQAYRVIVIDPLSSVASTLGLDFDTSNKDFVRFYDRLVQPLVAAGVAIVMVDNIGHAQEARSRAKGASAKSDRADLTFSCKAITNPQALVIRCRKVRTVRAAFRMDDEWIFERDTQQIETQTGDGESKSSFRPTVYMERVSRLVEGDPGLSKKSIRRSVSGDNKYIELALDLLVSESYVEARTDGQAHRHYSLKAFREADDEC